MTRRRRERTDADEDEAVVGCLDVLRGASALTAQHKAGLARLLPRRDERERGALERLVSDLTEVLSTASTSSGGSSSGQQVERERREEQEGGAVSDSEGSARRGGGGRAMAGAGAKRAKAQQAPRAGRGQQQVAPASSAASTAAVAACEGRDALAIPEVLEHVMSFAEDNELLGRLSRVCRLWRRVSESERLSLRVVEQHMPSALVGGASSLHARLGGRARRCLLAHNAMTAGRLICGEERLLDVAGLTMMIEIFHGRTVLCATSGRLCADYLEEELWVSIDHFSHAREEKLFSAASLGVESVDDIFRDGDLWFRFCVLDVATRVTANLFQGAFFHQGESPEPEGFFSEMVYTTAPVPVTSMTYAGPPLQAELHLRIRPSKRPARGEAGGLLAQTEGLWKICRSPDVRFTGQPSIYGERFIRTRLAEEAMAAKQHGSR